MCVCALQRTQSTTIVARYESVVREKEAVDKKTQDLKAQLEALSSSSSMFDGHHAHDRSNHSTSNSSFRDPHRARNGSFGGGAPGLLRRMSSSSSLGGFDAPNATTTNEYLKNIVLKYMTSDQEEV